MLSKRFRSHSVKSPCSDVSFELTVPLLPVVFREPRAELCQLLRVQALDLLFKILKSSHVGTNDNAVFAARETVQPIQTCESIAVRC